MHSFLSDRSVGSSFILYHIDVKNQLIFTKNRSEDIISEESTKIIFDFCANAPQVNPRGNP